MRAFITGGAGFIGSHLTDAMIARGDQVTILDNLSTGTKDNINHLQSGVKFVEGDIRDQRIVEELTQSADIVLHMAAAVGVQTIMHHTVESISTNFLGSEIVMKSALKFDKRLIIASTSEIYGKNPKQPLAETDDRLVGAPQKIRWSYADAKALEEAVAYSLFWSKGLRQTTLRFFNTVGPRQTGRYGMVLPNFVKSAQLNEPLCVYGNGLQSRVFCHVEDAVRAVLSVIDSPETYGEVFNVGGTTEISISDLAARVVSVLNSKSKIIYQEYSEVYPRGFEDMMRRVPDTSKIYNQLGWRASRDLNSIILDVADSYSRK